MKNQALAVVFALSCAALASVPAQAQTAAPAGGFYGGIAVREAWAESSRGVSFGVQSSVWGKFSSPVADDAAARTLLFGGYRFQNDLAVEAAVSTSDRYLLRPDNAAGRRGVGLSLMPSDAASHAWNADVYTSWSFARRFALYGRLGYAQADNPAGSLAAFAPGDVRRGRDGMNYGVGLRYDVNPALGLRVEYARFGRFAGETLQGGALPETDQVQLGVQLRF